MADLRKRITELPTSTSTAGLYTLGVNAQNEGVKIPIGDLLNGLQQPTQDALKTAQAANKTAGEAKTLAQTAAENASTALSTANDATSKAETANSVAEQANRNANTASATASEAEKTAGEAKTAVETNRVELDDIIRPRMFINAKELLSLTSSTTLATVIGALSTHKDSALFKRAGLVVTFPGEQGWE